MPRRPPLALALLLAAGCTGSAGAPQDGVQVPAVNGLRAAVLLDCRSLKAELPGTLADGPVRRPALPLSDSTDAWGDPPVTLRCGVAAGSGRDEPYTVNGVRWAVHDSGASHTWTTVGRTVNVAVEVPDAYGNPGEVVGAISVAVARRLS